MSRRRRSNSRAHMLRSVLTRWHRRTGIIAAIFFILLAITGVLLNHGHDLDLDHQPVTSHWLLRWYGIKINLPTQGFVVDGHWYLNANEQLLRDDQLLGSCKNLRGATSVTGIVAVLCSDKLLLLTENGELIEEITALPSTLTDIGRQGERIVARDAQGTAIIFDYNAGTWQPVTGAAVGNSETKWNTPQSLSPQFQTLAEKHIGNTDITWERVLLDLHSGRFFGPIGVWITDLAGLMMIALATSGLWVWSSRRHAQKSRHR